MRLWCSTLFFTLAMLLSCADKREPARYSHIGPDTLPAQSFERPPEQPFDRSDYVIKLKQMTNFYDVPGEWGYYINGEDNGFESLSIIMTETYPHGGPPLHTHETEEAHVLFSGTVEYFIGDRRFTVEGPYIARVPAAVPHTFLNVGKEPFNLTAVFPGKRLTYNQIGANPLVPQER